VQRSTIVRCADFLLNIDLN